MPFSRMGYFRKWAWADEQGWIRTMRLPFGRFRKDVNWTNPILDKSASGWDNSNVQFPCCIRKDGKYWLFYSGYGGTPCYQIGVAYADNPWGTFTKSGNNPIIANVGTHSLCSSVIYDAVDDKWKMWFLAYPAGVRTWYFSDADDPEGPWSAAVAVTSYPANYLATQGVIRLGNMYWAPYKITTGPTYPTHVMYSADGQTWVEQGKIVDVGAAGWDSTSLDYVSSFWNLGVFYTLYGGYDGTNTRIGLATSPWGFRYAGTDEFFKSPLNPVLDLGASGTWDDNLIGHPSLMMVDDKFYLWYMGFDGTANSHKIGLAQIP